MRILIMPGILEILQSKMTDQEFADHIGISRSQLWRIKLSPDDKRFSLGQDFIARLLSRFPDYKFEDIFFLDRMSHACYGSGHSVPSSNFNSA